MDKSQTYQKLPYLTKNSDSAKFQEHIKTKIDRIDQDMEELKLKVKNQKQKIKQMDIDEKEVLGDDKKMIPHFKKRRALRDLLVLNEDKLKKMAKEKLKLEHQSGKMKGWDLMFKSLNIDVNATKKKINMKSVEENSAPQKTTYLKKLNGIKRGFNFLVPSPSMKMNYDIQEMKYDLPSLYELNEQHKRDLELRRIAAGQKVKSKLETDQQRITHLSKSRMFSSQFFNSEPSSISKRRNQDASDQYDDAESRGFNNGEGEY